MTWQPERTEQLRQKEIGIVYQWLHESQVRIGVLPERRRGRLDRPIENGRRTVVEGVRQRDRRFDPGQTVALERQPSNERRRFGERVNRRTMVMSKAGKGQLFGSTAAPDRACRLIDGDVHAGLRQNDRRRKSIRTGANNYSALNIQVAGAVSHGASPDS
jgi:hypothetical protein